MKKKREQYFPYLGNMKLQIRKMKLTLILTLLVFVSFGNSFSQEKVSLYFDKASIQEIIEAVEDQTEYIFLYKDEILNRDQKYSIDLKETSFDEALQLICSTANVEYEIRNERQIILKEKTETKLIIPRQNTKSISGTVSGRDGVPIPGVSVVIQGTTTGAVTDINGEFTLEVPEDTQSLQFSFVGMKTQDVSIDGKTILNIVMSEETIGLEEVVAIGYGTMKKSDLTGSVASVRSEDFVKGVSTNALQLLQGKASGVAVHQSNSEPGGAITIRIRGAGSINSSNGVLVVIDGLPGGDPTSLNPDDIESMEILKDASAAAIYGTRAANGVVLITTKKGTSGIPVVSYNAYVGYQTPNYKFDVLNATQYLQMINDISADGGKPKPYTDAEIAAAGEGTDWQDEILRDAWVHNHQLSLNGGSENAKYYVSLGYLDQDGIMVSSGLKKYTTLINLELKPSKKFTFGLNLNANYNLKDIVPNTSNSPNENADPLNTAI